tara:strand:+ start:55 stop:1368 length:1314 start_codon:yes stop_codon:yes gene_type:complete
MAVTSTISPIQVGSGQGKKTLYTATKVTGPFGSPPKYETEIIRYDNAKGEGGKTIGTRSSDNPGKIEWNANASRLDKQNQKKIGQASAGQVKSIKNEVADNAQKKEALDKASGNNNKAEDNATNDAKVNKKANNILGSSLKDIESVGGTREDKFGVYVFPTTLRAGSQGQDFLKFDMMKYEPKEIVGAMEKGSLGLSDRKKDRKSIGTVILPIPGGIQDQQQVQWGSDSMDAAAIALSDIALSAITEGLGAGVDAAVNTAKNISKSDDAKKALATAIAGSASGAGNLLTRTTGAIMNPNMELLFNSPNLRSFNFSFTLAPRNKSEAMVVIKIIRFFKQGMSPIRSKSRLFLRSPHTFRLAYKHKVGLTNDKDDHPFLNKFKECALNGFGVNYTPSGQYSTYEDGVMTSYQMTMGFQELEPVYNDDYGNDTFPNEIGF